MCLRALETALVQLQKSRVIRNNFTKEYKGKRWDDVTHAYNNILGLVHFSFNNLLLKIYCTYIDELFSIENYQSALINNRKI